MEYKKLSLIFACFILAGALISASGISCDYSDDNPIEIPAGESVTTSCVLQNMAGEPKDVVFNLEITSGEEFASLVENSYDVPFGVEDVEVPIVFDIPRKTESGNYSVVIRLEQTSSGEGDNVKIAPGLNKKIALTVTKGKAISDETSSVLIGIVVLILLIAIIVYVRKEMTNCSKCKKKTSSKKKKK